MEERERDLDLDLYLFVFQCSSKFKSPMRANMYNGTRCWLISSGSGSIQWAGCVFKKLISVTTADRAHTNNNKRDQNTVRASEKAKRIIVKSF